MTARARANAKSSTSAAGPVAHQPTARPVDRKPSNQMLQRKLRVGRADDPLEREADRAAEAVVAGQPAPPISTAPAVAQRACAGCEAKEAKRRRNPDNDETDEDPMV